MLSKYMNHNFNVFCEQLWNEQPVNSQAAHKIELLNV